MTYSSYIRCFAMRCVAIARSSSSLTSSAEPETDAPPAPSGEKDARREGARNSRRGVVLDEGLGIPSAAERVSAAPDMRAASRGSSHCVSAFTGSGVAARMLFVTPAGEEGVSFFLITLPTPSAMSSAFTSRAAFFAADASTGLFTGAGIADFFTAFAPSFPSAGVSGFFFAAAFRGGGFAAFAAAAAASAAASRFLSAGVTASITDTAANAAALPNNAKTGSVASRTSRPRRSSRRPRAEKRR